MERQQLALRERHVGPQKQHHRCRCPRVTRRHRGAEYQAAQQTPLPTRDASSGVQPLKREVLAPAVVEAG